MLATSLSSSKGGRESAPAFTFTRQASRGRESVCVRERETFETFWDRVCFSQQPWQVQQFFFCSSLLSFSPQACWKISGRRRRREREREERERRDCFASILSSLSFRTWRGRRRWLSVASVATTAWTPWRAEAALSKSDSDSDRSRSGRRRERKKEKGKKAAV